MVSQTRCKIIIFFRLHQIKLDLSSDIPVFFCFQHCFTTQNNASLPLSSRSNRKAETFPAIATTLPTPRQSIKQTCQRTPSQIRSCHVPRADALLYGINLARKELSHPALFLFAFMLPLVSSCFILAKAILLTREIFWAAFFFFFWLSSLNETSNCQCRLFSIPQCFLATLSMVSASIGNEVI